MRKCLWFLGMTFVLGHNLQAQETFLNDLKDNLSAYHDKFTREKVYLHLDRQYFQPGDDLWFKAYVINASNHRLSQLSKTLHVLVADEQGNEILTAQFLTKSGRAQGDLKIPESIRSGAYKLVAYSSWMKNFEPEAVFQQEIKIIDRIVPNVFVEAVFDQDYYQDGEALKFDLTLTDLENQPIDGIKFEYSITNGYERLAEGKLRTDVQGKSSISFSIPNNNFYEDYMIRVFGDHNQQPFEFQWLVPTQDQFVDIQFLPEGGELLANAQQQVAFKALNAGGQPVGIQGMLVNESGDSILSFSSFYKGMGSFSFVPQPGEQYLAELQVNGTTRNIELPSVLQKGSSIAVKGEEKGIKVDVFNRHSKATTYYLTALQHEQLVFDTQLSITGDTSIWLNDTFFSSGIVRFTLFDQKRLPVAERLFFANSDKNLEIDLTTNKVNYKPRSKVEASIAVKDYLGNPVKGVFSVAVTDAILSNINQKSTGNMLSYFLLESELKGSIPTPEYYFQQDNSYAHKALDLVMLTHGWRRFLWDYVLMRDLEEEPAPISHDMKSGTVYNKKGEIVPGAEVQIVQLGQMNAYFLETDERGKFYLPFTIQSTESKDFIFNAVSPYQKGELEVRLDTEEEDPFRAAIRSSLLPTEGNLAAAERGRKKAVGSAVFADLDFGDNYQLLEEIEILGDAVKQEESLSVHEKYELRNQMSVMSHYFIQSRDEEQLNIMANGSTSLNNTSGGFIDLVKQVSNIYKYNPNTGFVILRTNDLLMNAEKRLGALVVVNGTPIGQDLRALNHLSAMDIEKIDVIKTSAMAVYYGNRAAAGAILVTTKRGISKPLAENTIDESQVAVDDNITVAREFYAPRYETEEDRAMATPDARKTLYWNPEIYTDERGEASFSFFTDDRITNLTLEIQGISGDGKFGFASNAVSTVPINKKD